VRAALAARGLQRDVLELPASTRTAAEAAAAVGCQVGQIAKSLVFRAEATGEPVLVIASGPNRVDGVMVGAALGLGRLVKADADFVRAQTGYSIGGVPPVGHLRPLTTVIDLDLEQHAVIWAAAGTPHAVFQLTPAELRALTHGEVMDVG
jgi:prolyl-tRNA editing enzyme YbaK/EbsC (Cys-tRNA(Pro) deacylase)